MKTTILLYLLCCVEGTPNHDVREGYIHRPFNITPGLVTDVNREYDLRYTMNDLRRNRAVRVAYVRLYLRKYKALDSYENAIRTWTGGPYNKRGWRANRSWATAKRVLHHYETVLVEAR